jgi:cytoskeletal protein CcmA (bactofilin family)
MPAALSIIHSADPVDKVVVVADLPVNPLRSFTVPDWHTESPSKAGEAIASHPVLPSPVTAPAADIEYFTRHLDVKKLMLIPHGVTINGSIDTNGLASIIISGTVNGNVTAGSGAVIVRKSGVVFGTIKADDCVVVVGQVTGNKAPAIVTKGLWMLAETGQVHGDVAYSRYRAYDGGLFSGRAIPFSE